MITAAAKILADYFADQTDSFVVAVDDIDAAEAAIERLRAAASATSRPRTMEEAAAALSAESPPWSDVKDASIVLFDMGLLPTQVSRICEGERPMLVGA